METGAPVMLAEKAIDKPIRGKTFSLYGESLDTSGYYCAIDELADEFIRLCPDAAKLLYQVQKASETKRLLRRRIKNPKSDSFISFIVNRLHEKMSVYTSEVKSHLQELPSISRLADETLGTTEEQYHIYMLEIELTNRIFKESFKSAEVKVAFLPHCLRDLEAKCRAKAEPGDADYTCKGCSKLCHVNRVSALLKTRAIKPYIWMDADLPSLFKELRAKGSLGMLGIACIPELIDGMRLCRHAEIPVVGIPLNANRCARWMGEFYPTSVDLKELEKLVS